MATTNSKPATPAPLTPAPLNRDLVRQVLADNSLMVVSTLAAGDQPQSAVVGYTELPDFSLIVGTSKHSRKIANLRQHAQLSCVIGWDDVQRVTIQLDGVGRLLSRDEVQQHSQAIIDKVPQKAHYLEDYLAGKGDDVYVLIRPTWIRCTEAASWPWIVTEERLLDAAA